MAKRTLLGLVGSGESFAPKLLEDKYLIYLSIYSKIGGFLVTLMYFYDQSKNGHFIR